MNNPVNAYTGMPLNRNSVPREDSDWVARHLASEQALFLPLNQNANLVEWHPSSEEPRGIYLSRTEASRLFVETVRIIYLGHHDKSPVFAADLSEAEEGIIDIAVHSSSTKREFIDLRQIGPALEKRQASILAYARALCYWHRQHLFCSRCGNQTKARKGGHMRLCMNTDCNRETYPRIDPAVIMLVESRSSNNTPICLLGRHPGLPKGVYSTLAGYVDPGETLEEAVAREVHEESGVRVSNIQYVASQPWPFPSSMMIGFRAQADTREIDITKDELEDAQWFTLEQILEFGEYNDGHSEMALPRKDSIARTLIEAWIAENQKSSD